MQIGVKYGIMAIIRPRLNDYHGLMFTQAEVDFAIPFVDEDIPLYLDPFLLWKSPSQQDNALHINILDSFNYLGELYKTEPDVAKKILVDLSECDEVGLGDSKVKVGKRIGEDLATKILETFISIPQVSQKGYSHFEEIQLLVDGFSKDRVSDIASNLLKSFLIDFTIQQCKKYSIPISHVKISFFDLKVREIVTEDVELPVNPETNTPILLVPKRWLRFVPWLNFEDYFEEYISTSERLLSGRKISRVEVLEYNRKNYDVVKQYIEKMQLQQSNCKNDPLFSQIPVISSKRKLNTILKLPTGKESNADKEFERLLCPLLASMLYPDLDFANTQERTDSGVLIRDLIFYNNVSHPFLQEIFTKFESRQLVFELKNVKTVESEHVNQVNRYLNNEFGRFGVIFTRNKPLPKVYKNTIDLWSGQRKCILILDEADLQLMCEIFQSKQRSPIDVLKRKYVEFTRSCPS